VNLTDFAKKIASYMPLTLQKSTKFKQALANTLSKNSKA
jgi:hypothetical protein